MFVTSRCTSTADYLPTLLHVGLSDINFASQVKNLGPIMDCYLTLHQYVTNVCASAYTELLCIASVHQYLSCDATRMLISVFFLLLNTRLL